MPSLSSTRAVISDRMAMKMTPILSVCVFLCAVTTTLAATWDLSAVKITLPARPNRVQRLAAQELVDHLTRITGAAPSGAACECVFAPPPGAAPVQNFEAFCRIEGTKAWFWGDDDSQPKVGGGTLFAVYAFLNKRLGVDWVYPGDDGVVFRRRKTVEMPDSWNDRYCPPLTQTGIRNYFGTPKVIEKEDQVPPAMRLSEVEAKKRLADVARWYQRRRLQSRERIPYGHAFLNWQDRFLKTHPEYLCQPRADNPDRGMTHARWGFKYGKLCVSCEGVVEQIIADWVAKGKPKYINICENDGRSYCRCAACCALDAPKSADEPFDAHKTDRYVNFWNRVAKKAVPLRPDVILSAYIYSDYRLPPRREKVAFPDNMYFGIVPSLIDDYAADYAAWKAVGMRHFFLRPNFHAYWGVLPRGCEKAIYDNFQTSRKFGIVGVDYDGYPGRYPTQPDYYITARMVVEPDGKFEDFMRDFCAAWGEGADVASAYFARLRERGERKIAEMRAQRGQGPGDGTYDYRTSIHTVAELEADLAFLEQAQKGLSFAEPECARRFRELVVRARHYVLTAKFYEAARAKDIPAREDAAWRVLAFRREHLAELPDFYANLFAGTFACGEAWAWRGCLAYRAAMGDVAVPAEGPRQGWTCTFDAGRLGWWVPREAFGGCITNAVGAAGSAGAFWLKAGGRNTLGVSAKVDLIPGSRYRYAADFRVEGSAKGAGLRILFPKGTSGATTPAVHKVFGDLGAEWTTRSMEFVVPADVNSAMFYVNVGKSKTEARLWCDNISLHRLD